MEKFVASVRNGPATEFRPLVSIGSSLERRNPYQRVLPHRQQPNETPLGAIHTQKCRIAKSPPLLAVPLRLEQDLRCPYPVASLKDEASDTYSVRAVAYGAITFTNFHMAANLIFRQSPGFHYGEDEISVELCSSHLNSQR